MRPREVLELGGGQGDGRLELCRGLVCGRQARLRLACMGQGEICGHLGWGVKVEVPAGGSMTMLMLPVEMSP